MALSVGARLGPYEVLGLIGSGGMGEVYKARDTRLDRTVAIKVLPASVAADPDRRQRFEREARTISQLSHPHICALYDVGEASAPDSVGAGFSRPDLQFLVMEHLDGETLADRLKRGPLPLAQSLDLGAQIADALACAHRQGIIHRDLKPGNVMLARSSAGSGPPTVKLLDFGLAKLKRHGEQPAFATATATPTESDPLTAQGTILGTLPYMAPEQLEGKPADARTDLWALGAILYEMAAGRQAFEGTSAASLIGNIMNAEPPALATLQPLTPPALERLVRTCLAKDPEQRFHSAHDLSLEIGWLRDMLGQAGPTAVEPRRRRPAWLGVLAGALAGVAVALAVGKVVWQSAAPGRPVVRYTVEVPPSQDLGGLALSPDGSQLVYVGVDGNRAALYRRSRDEFAATAIPGTEGGWSPFFSPDGQWLAFFRTGRLLKVRLDGRDLTTICATSKDADPSAGRTEPLSVQEGITYSGRWGDDGTIVFSGTYSPLWRVSSSLGAALAPITQLDSTQGELAHLWPVLLPDAKTLLYSVLTGMSFDAVPVAAASLETGARQAVLPHAPAATYLPTGHLLYGDRGSLVAVPFDPARLQAIGAPVAIADDIGYASTLFGAGWAPLFAVSRAGDLAYVSARPGAPSELIRVDRRGRTESIARLPAGVSSAMSLAPDGRRLVLYKVEARQMSLWLLDLERGLLTRLDTHGNPHAAIWSPDGSRLAFSSDRSGAANLFAQSVDGTSAVERLVTGAQHQDPGSWSRDGKWLAYAEVDPRSGWDLWVLDLTAGNPAPFRRTPANEQHPAISPDGRWVAYASDETGRFEVYVEAFGGGGQRQQVSVEGGEEPIWRLDGRELFYRAGPHVMGVRVRPGEAISLQEPVKIVEGAFRFSTAYGPPGYAVSADGQHFYLVKAVQPPPAPTLIQVVLGWLDEFRQRMEG